MKHHIYNPSYKFVIEPMHFNRNTNRELLQYCLGATLYMPGTKDICSKIVTQSMGGLTSMVMCFEDAIDENDLSKAEDNVLNLLEVLSDTIEKGQLSIDNIPLIMIRVRNPEQFIRFTKRIRKNQLKLVTGFVFPKFSTNNGYQYLGHLAEINIFDDCQIYGLPILESREIAMKETRTYELTGIKNMLKPYRDSILNIRVGATDFSSNFGVRRGMDYSIYDILMVRDCLSDILNFLLRAEDDYVISAPVWEYFLTDDKDVVRPAVEADIHTSLLKRNRIVNPAIDGLLREVILDKANGFVGKTIIHPTHLKYVNAMQAVTKEEYEDAMQILNTDGGVIKSARSNKMNEINPHRSWAQKIAYKAKAYGVIENDAAYQDLFSID
ncbi:MAG: HpcH/HpaI aldolase/citrate lyase family protein [Candidatus Cloacimonetes bacterium]|nr:HpcH/HpaI aldolase/citrate lyase family protein [Candidatus Cloacimonadota bacterium]